MKSIGVNNCKKYRTDANELFYNKQRNLVNRILKNAEKGHHITISHKKLKTKKQWNFADTKLENVTNTRKNKFFPFSFRRTHNQFDIANP